MLFRFIRPYLELPSQVLDGFGHAILRSGKADTDFGHTKIFFHSFNKISYSLIDYGNFFSWLT